MSRSNKKREREFIYLFIYGCCPGGLWPARFLATSCRPSPLHSGCCRGCLCPEEVSQACLILAATGAATNETSIATDSAPAIAASAANVTLLVFISSHDITDYED